MLYPWGTPVAPPVGDANKPPWFCVWFENLQKWVYENDHFYATNGDRAKIFRELTAEGAGNNILKSQ